jgi:ribonuclease BN (tRNA processing enzyme)
MEIVFAGTGSGKVNLKRSHSSIMIKYGKTRLLVDAGDGVSRALIKSKIKPVQLDAIFITHAHSDHFNGLPTLITQMKMAKRKKPLSILLNETLVKALELFLKQSYIFQEKLDFEIKIVPLKNNEKYSVSSSFEFITKQNSHLNKYSEFAKAGDLSLSSNSVLFFIEDKKVFYTGDLGGKDDLYLFKDEKIDYLICETTHIMQDDIFEYLSFAKPKAVYMTHIDDKLIKDGCFTKLAEKENVFFASDKMKLII